MPGHYNEYNDQCSNEYDRRSMMDAAVNVIDVESSSAVIDLYTTMLTWCIRP
jgi:hypothetical protein